MRKGREIKNKIKQLLEIKECVNKKDYPKQSPFGENFFDVELEKEKKQNTIKKIKLNKAKDKLIRKYFENKKNLSFQINRKTKLNENCMNFLQLTLVCTNAIKSNFINVNKKQLKK